MEWVLLIILVLLLIGLLPTWPYSRTRSWGYYPSGAVLVVLIIVLIVLFV